MLPTDTVLKLALAPVLVAQALRVRRGAQLLPEPPGARAGQAGQGAPLRLLILGDSSAAGVGAAHQDEALSGQLVRGLAGDFQVDWRLQAQTGATTASVLSSVGDMAPMPADVALIVLGVNDVTSQVPLARLRARRRALYDHVRDRFGGPRLIASGVPPLGDFPLLPQPLRGVLGRQAARFDRVLAADAEAAGVTYMRFDLPLTPEMMAADGFHPAAVAYALWARRTAEVIRGAVRGQA